MNNQQLVSPDDLIIIITTSPIQSNPSTEIIDMAIESIEKQASLALVPIYIICDGVKLTEEKTSKFKSGIVSEQAFQDYQAFKTNIKLKYGSKSRITIEERAWRYCFAENIRYVMSKIPQPFVMIFQHDHVFLRQVNISQLISRMKQHPINYIGFMNKSVKNLPHELDQHLELRRYLSQKVGYKPNIVRHDHQIFLRQVLDYYHKQYQIPLIPLLFWYDKVHIAKKSYYLDVIFNPKGFHDQIKNIWMKTVSFVEDSFGTVARKTIRKYPEKLQTLSAFILWDSAESAIEHSGGRGFITQQVKQQLYLKHMKPKDNKSESSDKSQDEEPYNLEMLSSSEYKQLQ